MKDFKLYLKQEEISMKTINALVCNGVVCDLCHSNSAIKIISNKSKIKIKFHIETQAIKVCQECLKKIYETR